jgi:hypothetical protein
VKQRSAAAEQTPKQSSCRENTVLPLADQPGHDYLASIGFLAVLAFPESFRARDAFVAISKKHLNALYNLRHPRGKRLPAGRVAEILKSGPITGAASRIQRRRLRAADVAEAVYLRWASQGTWLRFEAKVGDVVIRSTREGLQLLDQRGNLSNAYTRVWTESKPVLHLARALRSLFLEPEWNALLAKRGLWGLIERPDWVRSALRNAELLRLLPSPFRIRSEGTVRLIGEEPSAGEKLKLENAVRM